MLNVVPINSDLILSNEEKKFFFFQKKKIVTYKKMRTKMEIFSSIFSLTRISRIKHACDHYL